MKHPVVCILFPGGNQVDFSTFAEACLRFTPTVAVREGEAVFLDMTGCEKHGSQESLSARIQVLASRFSPNPVKLGFASRAGTALALARWSKRASERLPLEALMDYVSPFQINFELNQKIQNLVQTLRELGLVSLEDFLEIPSLSFASRFGKEAMRVYQAVEGSELQAWPGFVPVQKIEEQLDFMEEVWGLDPLLFGLRSLLDRITSRLRGLSKRISVLQIEFHLTRWSTVQKESKRLWRIEFPLAQGSSLGILPILQEKLNFDLQKTPLPSPVQAIRLEVLETVPGGRAQKDFLCNREEEMELWNAWVSRLSVRLGQENVFMAATVDRYLPEKSWVKTLELSRESEILDQPSRILPARPSRILKTPIRLYLRGSILFHPQGKRWEVQEWHGPERLSGEWWLESEFDRDYYRVLSSNGEQLWVFVKPYFNYSGFKSLNSERRFQHLDEDSEGFYLHGYFD